MVNFHLKSLVSFVASVLLMIIVPVASQQSDDGLKALALLKDGLAEKDSAVNQKEPILPENEVSDVRIISRFLIRLYQTCVSSQQHNVCVFSPSCSHFGMEAVEQYGFVRGVLLTADRLTRCNNFVSQGGYAFDPAIGKFVDPVASHSSDSTSTLSCGPSCGVPVP